jgi:DNA-binding CsgD family transcriptional regulator
VADGEAAGLDTAVVLGLCALAEVELRRGRLRHAARSAAEAVRRADLPGSAARRHHPRLTLGLTSLALDRLDASEQALLAVRQEAEEFGSSWSLPFLHVRQAALFMAWGRLEEAAAEAEAALAIAGEAGAPHLAAQALALLAQARLRLGTLGPLGPARRRARELAVEADSADPSLVWAMAVLADADADPAGALRLLGAHGQGWPAPELVAVDPLAAPHAGRIALRAGDRERAAAAAAQVARLARLNEHLPTMVGCALHANGLLTADVVWLRQAADALAESPRPLALASALEDLGKALRARDRRDDAIAALAEALAIYSAAGAARDGARARHALRGLGVRRRHGAARQGLGRAWDSLTRTELAVVALVAEGLTNRVIADRLFVSSSTVNTHLRHIFTKLGINSRVQLTRLALRLGAG